MVKNRLNPKLNTHVQTPEAKEDAEKIWAILYKERNKFVYISTQQLKDLLDIDRVKITGKYQVIDFNGIQKKVWVDGEVKLSLEELKKIQDLKDETDYVD